MVSVSRALLVPALLAIATKAATNNVLVKFKKDRVKNANTKLGQFQELNDKVVYTYESTFIGVALKGLSDQQVKNLALDDDVEVVEPDGTITVDGFDNNVDPIMFNKDKVSAQGNQTTNLRNWGLDRIDDEKGTDGSYEYEFAGNGVTVYIFDTGVSKDHIDFGGRVQDECWTDFSLEGCGDGHGHGTHVAGIAAGLYSGVAKEASIVSIKVLDNAGSGSWSGLVAGLEYVKTSREEMSDPPPAVINMSLGGEGISTIVSDAIVAIINTGVVVTVAAGNDYAADACDYTPAFVPEAITVASSDSNDDRSSFSNVGTCVDIFAPGSDIFSSSHVDPNLYVSKSGTSMAAPMVAGVATLYLESDPSLSPIQVRNLMVNHALRNIVTDVRGSPNRLLYTAKVGDPPSPTAAPEPTLAPTALPLLYHGVSTDPFSLNAGQSRSFGYGASGNLNVRCTVNGPNGDADLYLRWGDYPTNSNNDCSSTSSDSTEECVVDNPGDGSTLVVTVYAWSAFSGVVLMCEDMAASPTHSPTLSVSPTASVSPTTLVSNLPTFQIYDGVPTDPFSLTGGMSQYFMYSTGTLWQVRCTTIGRNGDADLYVLWDQLPTRSDYDCRSTSGDSNEECLVDSPGVDATLFVLVYAWSTFSGIVLMCEDLALPSAHPTTETHLPTPAPSVLPVFEIYNGIPTDPFSLTSDASLFFRLSSGAMLQVQCAISGPNGDADLYVHWDQLPTRSDYDCRSTSGDSNEECLVDSPGVDSTLFVLIYAWSAFSGVVLMCEELALPSVHPTTETQLPTPAPSVLPVFEIHNGVPTDPFSLTFGKSRLFRLLSGAMLQVQCAISGPNGDADLYVRWDGHPTAFDYDCKSASDDSTEECLMDNLGGSEELFLMVYAYAGFSNVVLTCESLGGQNPDPTQSPTQVPTTNQCPCGRFQLICRLLRLRLCFFRDEDE